MSPEVLELIEVLRDVEFEVSLVLGFRGFLDLDRSLLDSGFFDFSLDGSLLDFAELALFALFFSFGLGSCRLGFVILFLVPTFLALCSSISSSSLEDSSLVDVWFLFVYSNFAL